MNTTQTPEIDNLTTEFNMTLVAGSVKGAMKTADAKSRDLWFVPIEMIRRIPEFNVRVRDENYLAHLRNIANSIKTEGFYPSHPLEGYVANENGENVIYLTGGYTRHEATGMANAEGAEIQLLPIVVAPPGTSREDLVVALVKGNEGKPLTPYEVAIVCKRLTGYGWDTRVIAERLDIAENYVEGLLLLIGAPLEIRSMVQSGELAATLAIQELRAKGSKAVETLSDGLNRAKAAGATRVTAKYLPGAAFKKVFKTAAPKMYAVVKDLRVDPGYANISNDLRAKLDELFDQLAAVEEGDKAEATETAPQ